MINPFTLKFRSSEIETSYDQKRAMPYSIVLKSQTFIFWLIIFGLLIYNIQNGILTEARKIRDITFLLSYAISFFILCKYKVHTNKIAFFLNVISTTLLGEVIKVLIEMEKNGLIEKNPDTKISSLFLLFHSYALFQSIYFQTSSWIISFISILFNFIYYPCILDINEFHKYLIIYAGVGLIILILSYSIEKSRRNMFYEEFQNNQIYEHYKFVLIKLSSNIKVLMKRKNESNFITENSISENYDINLINDFAKDKYGLVDFKSLEKFFQEIEIENQDFLTKNLIKFKTIFPQNEQEINLNFHSFKNLLQYSNFLLLKKLKINEDEPIIITLEAHKIGEISQKFTINFLFYYWKNDIYMLLTINDFYLEEKIQELIELDKYKDQVLANVTHDLRTPLNGMLFLINEVKETECEKNKNSMKIAEIQGKLLMSLINDILDYSRCKTNNLNLNIHTFDLKKCIEEIYILFEEKTKINKISLILDYPKEQILINSDENRLKQILINLIGNSIKFTTEGYVKLKVSKLFNFIQFDIYDTGVGIYKEQIEKLFLPFSTFDTGGLNKNGIGLGLLISRKIIERLGGGENIVIKSVVGEGSQFTFKIYKNLENFECSSIQIPKENLNISYELSEEQILPKKSNSQYDFHNYTMQDLMKVTNKKSTESTITSISMNNLYDKNKEITELKTSIKNILITRTKSINILFVDDNFLNILVLQTYLSEIKSDKIKTDTAVNGKNAYLKFITQNKPNSDDPYNFIIMDCEMPIMNGFEASNNINMLINNDNYSKCKIIGYSANNNENEIKKCMEAGMIDFIEKPCTIFAFYHLLLRNLKLFYE